jgi:hypothetical protein
MARAQAVATERAAEMRQQGDVAGHDLWQQISAAICELRRTARSSQRPQVAWKILRPRECGGPRLM